LTNKLMIVWAPPHCLFRSRHQHRRDCFGPESDVGDARSWFLIIVGDVAIFWQEVVKMVRQTVASRAASDRRNGQRPDSDPIRVGIQARRRDILKRIYVLYGWQSGRRSSIVDVDEPCLP